MRVMTSTGLVLLVLFMMIGCATTGPEKAASALPELLDQQVKEQGILGMAMARVERDAGRYGAAHWNRRKQRDNVGFRRWNAGDASSRRVWNCG